MYLYYSLRNLAITFGWLRREFYDSGNAIRNVFIIGAHLSGFLFAVADFFGDVEDHVMNAAGDWRAIYEWILDNLGNSNVPALLLRYADDLISFIQDPFGWIADAIRDHMPVLYRIAQDPIEWVLETLYRYTGLDVDFVDNPRRIIRDIIDNAIGNVRDIIDNPFDWLRDRMSEVIPDFWEFIYDAQGWIRRRVEDAFPFLISFLNDPDGFIVDKLENFIDDLGDKYQSRVIKVAEKILNAIF